MIIVVNKKLWTLKSECAPLITPMENVKENGLNADAREFLSAMRRIAQAESHTDYTTAVLAFRTSNLYVTNKLRG